MRTSISDFTFLPAGHGHYRVTFVSPKTGATFIRTTSNMPLIDATKNADQPKQKDLNELKRFCKGF